MNEKEHLLVCLSEECAEVQHAIAKALRFGLDDGYPESTTTNADDILNELADITAVVEMLEERKIINRTTSIEHAIKKKKERVEHYMKHAIFTGALQVYESE